MTKNTMTALAAIINASNSLSDGARLIAMTQALLETGRGTSPLFAEHNNPWGMKFRQRIADWAKPVNHVASDGAGTYAAFASLTDAVEGYAAFVATGPYPATVDDSAEAWLDSLVEGGYATDPAYRDKITTLMPEAAALLEGAAPQASSVAFKRAGAKLPKLVVIVGHNAASQGAAGVAPLNESEYAYNSDVAELMAEGAAEYAIDVDIVYREAGLTYAEEIDRAYATADAAGADATIELHFNASGLAVGTETLSSGSPRSLAFAAAVQRELVALCGRTGNGNRGVKVRGPGDRGGRSLHAGRAPAIMPEPFFGSNPAEARLAVQIGKAALAEAYLAGAAAWFAAERTADAA